MRVEVAYGELSMEAIESRFDCRACTGPHAWQQPESCPSCGSTGKAKHSSPTTYAYDVSPGTEVGAKVVCPPSWVPGSTAQIGTVVSTSSEYTGPVKAARAA